MKRENCNRCCSEKSIKIKDKIKCKNCGFIETFEIWQLKGWRSILKYPPTYSGTIFVYGKNIGRKEAKWDSEKKECSVKEATHWLRTPDPRVQIGMDE